MRTVTRHVKVAANNCSLLNCQTFIRHGWLVEQFPRFACQSEGPCGDGVDIEMDMARKRKECLQLTRFEVGSTTIMSRSQDLIGDWRA